MKYLLSLACLMIFVLPLLAQPSQKLMAVVAHPDDESAFAEVLLHYARKGYQVQLVIATDGKDGTRVTAIPAGDSLGNLRKQESSCACQILGIDQPVFLGVERLDTRHGVGRYFDAHKVLLERLKEQLLIYQPHLIITFGPDGDTHHAEHIVIGAAVTELLLREAWVDRFPLYYLAWTQEQGQLYDLGFVHQDYFNVAVPYSQEEENKALDIMPCYVSQYTPQELAHDRHSKLQEMSNTLYFRRFVVQKGLKKGF